jgi:hypothetical protein
MRCRSTPVPEETMRCRSTAPSQGRRNKVNSVVQYSGVAQRDAGSIKIRELLDGLLKYYHRRAA